MAYQIGHAPAPSIAKAAIWVADNTTGGGAWYSIAEFLALLGISAPIPLPTPTAASQVLTSSGATAGAWKWQLPTYD